MIANIDTCEIEFIPAEWLARSVRVAAHGGRLEVYSRPVQIERRWHNISVVLDRRADEMASYETVESLLRALCGPKT